MGTCLSSSSINLSSTRAALTAAPEVAMYNKSSAFSEGLDMTARFSINVFKASNVFACSSPHCMLRAPFSALKNGRDFSADLEIRNVSLSLWRVRDQAGEQRVAGDVARAPTHPPTMDEKEFRRMLDLFPV